MIVSANKFTKGLAWLLTQNIFFVLNMSEMCTQIFYLARNYCNISLRKAYIQNTPLKEQQK